MTSTRGSSFPSDSCGPQIATWWPRSTSSLLSRATCPNAPPSLGLTTINRRATEAMVFGVSARLAGLARRDVVLAVRQHGVAPMPEQTTPRVSAVILAYNRADALDVVIDRLAGV